MTPMTGRATFLTIATRWLSGQDEVGIMLDGRSDTHEVCFRTSSQMKVQKWMWMWD